MTANSSRCRRRRAGEEQKETRGEDVCVFRLCMCARIKCPKILDEKRIRPLPNCVDCRLGLDCSDTCVDEKGRQMKKKTKLVTRKRHENAETEK